MASSTKIEEFIIISRSNGSSSLPLYIISSLLRYDNIFDVILNFWLITFYITLEVIYYDAEFAKILGLIRL